MSALQAISPLENNAPMMTSNSSAKPRSRGNFADQQKEIPLLEQDLRRIAKFLELDAGIHISESKTSLVHSRLIKRLRTQGFDTFHQYCNFVDSFEGKAERKEMLLALTTNLTRFFREPHHFEHVLKTALPSLVEKAKQGGKVRIWSAGCSNGQEPYSIAALALSMFPNANQYDFKILATDIDTNMINHGRQGVYNEDLMEKMPQKLRHAHFQSKEIDGEAFFRASDDMRNLVTFRELNLNGARWPMSGKFDIIFCRNVVIYFNQETQDVLWRRFKDHLNPQAFLYIGHSERLIGGIADDFENVGTTTFQLK